MFEYVKELSDGVWEVKLGAGILPIVITRQTLQSYNALSGGTITPNKAIDEFIKEANAVAAVNKWLSEKD